MTADRLAYVKQVVNEDQKKRNDILLRRNDAEWMIGEIERLRKEALEEDRLLKQGKFEVGK